MGQGKKLKILHLIDGLGGGGSEEWVKEIVALSDGTRYEYVVAGILRGSKGRFSYKSEMEKLGVKTLYLERDSGNGNGSTIEKEISFIKDIMKNSFSGNYFATAANLLGSSIKKGRIINLLRLTHEGAALLVKLFLLLKKEKIDVIHTHLFYAFIFGGLTGKLLKIPVVYSVPAMKSQMDGPFPWVFPMYRRLGFLIDTFMTGISKEELTAHGVPLKKIVLFHGSINLDKITQTRRDSNPIIERYGLEDSYPILLSVGRFDPSKGHQHSLEAVAKLKEKFPSIKLIILGEGLEYEKYLDIVEKDVSLTDIVTLPGFVKDPGPFYSAADIYLRTTLYEGMNRAGYLAMAYSKPVVGFDTRAPTEAVVDGENGLLVPVGDTEELAESISRLAADKALQKKLGSGALWYIVENQNISSAINAFEQAYSKLVRGGYNK